MSHSSTQTELEILNTETFINRLPIKWSKINWRDFSEVEVYE